MTLAGSAAAVPATGAPGRAPLARMARLLRRKPLGAAGGAVFLVFLLSGIFADVVAPHGFNDTDLRHRLEPPSAAFPFGTDHLGRDVLSRVIHGARLSMIVSVAGAGLATLVSLVLGAVSGFFGGWLDLTIQRLVDGWMIFPPLVLLIVVVSIVGPGILQISVVLGLLYGIAGSRIVRGATTTLREDDYAMAARSLGAGPLHILLRHIVPNLAPLLLVLFTTRLGVVILAEAGLSFLGLGVPPPTPTWGGMLSGSARTYMYLGPWLVLAPGLALTAAVYSINVFGDALRDLLDPRMRGTR